MTSTSPTSILNLEPNAEVLNKMLSLEIVSDWKEAKDAGSSFHDYVKNLLLSKRFVDVIVHVLDGSGNVEEVSCHRCILKFHSDFFAASLSERWEHTRAIDLTPYEFNSSEFKGFIEFIYTGTTQITTENCVRLYQLATLLLSKSFEMTLDEFIIQNVNTDNVFPIYQHVWFLKGDGKLVEGLNEFIRVSGQKLLSKPDMMSFDREQMKSIFRRPVKNATCLQILRFCLKWVEFRYGQAFLQNHDQLDHLFLNEFNLKDHCTTSENTNRDSDSFPKLSDLISYYDNLDSNQPGTSYTVNRFNKKTFCRSWSYRGNRFDKIGVRFSHTVTLAGIGLYGDSRFDRYVPDPSLRQRPAKYRVTVKVYHEGRAQSELSSCTKSNCGSSFERPMYYVDLTPAPMLIADVWYTIAVQIKGKQETWCGQKGTESRLIMCDQLPLIVEFKDVLPETDRELLSNGTGLTIGQIPELRFKINESRIEEDDDISVYIA